MAYQAYTGTPRQVSDLSLYGRMIGACRSANPQAQMPRVRFDYLNEQRADLITAQAKRLGLTPCE